MQSNANRSSSRERFWTQSFSKDTAFRHNYGFFAQRVTKIMS